MRIEKSIYFNQTNDKDAKKMKVKIDNINFRSFLIVISLCLSVSVIPQNYAANLETETTMSELTSCINQNLKKRIESGGKQILTKLNGGVPIRLKTTVGNISVDSR